MALVQVEFFSKTLMRTVTVNAVIPSDKLEPNEPKKAYKTLYLLHGIFGNFTDWLTGTRIGPWAQDRDLAVIMPSGENKFYVDNPDSGDYYGKFIGEELVEFTRNTFPLSNKREDTFIGGLSMGGYGALRNGLKYSDTFGSIVALSSALLLEGIMNAAYQEGGWSMNNRHYYETIWGDLSKLPGSDMDYETLAKGFADKTDAFPHLYLACGTEDFFHKENLAYHKLLDTLHLPHTYVSAPGEHNWDFWDAYIRKALDWLPLDGSVPKVNSGNVNA